MDQQNQHPNFQGHHGDPLKALLFQLKLALKIKHQDENFHFPPYIKLKNTIVAVGEKNILELPSKFTPLEESNPFAEDHKHRKATKHRQTPLLIIAIEMKIYYNLGLTDG